MEQNTITTEMFEELRKPFSKDCLEWRAIRTTEKNGGMGLAYAYITPRAVMDRLDEVFGNDWNLHIQVISDTGSRAVVKATIDYKIYIIREGIGESPILAKDGIITNEPWKSAESDAIKRAAVLFGIGRYLYSLPSLWLPYDIQKGKFTVDCYDEVFDKNGKVKPEAEAKNSKRKVVNVAPKPIAKKKVDPDPPEYNDALDVIALSPSRAKKAVPEEPDPEDTESQEVIAQITSKATTDIISSWLESYGVTETYTSRNDAIEAMFNTINNMNETPLTKQQLKVIVDMSEKKGIPLPENLAELTIKTASPIIGSLLQKK